MWVGAQASLVSVTGITNMPIPSPILVTSFLHVVTSHAIRPPASLTNLAYCEHNRIQQFLGKTHSSINRLTFGANAGTDSRDSHHKSSDGLYNINHVTQQS